MAKEKLGKFELVISSDDPVIAYLKLPTYIKNGISKASKTIRLFDLIGKYKGPDIYFNFDMFDELVGIEILD